MNSEIGSPVFLDVQGLPLITALEWPCIHPGIKWGRDIGPVESAA